MSEPLAIATKKPTPKSTRSEKFKWRRYLVILATILVSIYLLSLILLNTSWAKSKLTHRLREKTNTDWKIGNVHWLPLGDIVLNDLQSNMGEGGVKIKSIRVDPAWNLLFSGSLEVMKATVIDAEVDLDLRWLAENRTKIEGVILESAPAPQLNQATQPQRHPTETSKNQVPNSPQTTPKKPNPVPAQEIVSEKIINIQPNRWLKLKNMNFTLRHGGKIIEKISNLSASIPIAGKSAKGEVRFQFLGNEHLHEVIWDGQDLKAEETKGKFFDINFQWRAVCRINQVGVPFAFQLMIPQQKLNHIIDKPNIHLSISSEKIAANFILNGGLKNPNSWRGLLNVFSEKTSMIESQKTHKRLDFDQTRLVATLTNGNLFIPVAEAIGHKTSILANGSVHKNLYSYGTVRIIANQEATDFFERTHQGSGSIHVDHGHHLLVPLNTPDRMYCDIYMDGKLTNLEIRHDRSDRWQSFNHSIKKLINFKNNELKEDGLLENE